MTQLSYHATVSRLLLLAVGGWPISQPPRAEAFSRPSAQPVYTQRCVRVCVSAQGRGVRICMCICVRWVFAQFLLVCWPHCTSRPQHWPSRLNRPIQAGKSVDQWSHVPTGTVVEQIAPIAAVMNATSVHSLQRTTPNPLSSPELTLCVSSQSPRTILRSPVPTTPMWIRLMTVASQLASCSLVYVNNCASRRFAVVGGYKSVGLRKLCSAPGRHGAAEPCGPH